ncbi:MAG: HepT-like ribonuclease domain-containing protein [Candidatus Diapherotrites archaeon]
MERFHKNSFPEFLADEAIQDVYIRQLEIIREAMKNLPENTVKKKLGIKRKSFARLRDKLIHCYFGVDLRIVWNVAKKELVPLKKQVSEILLEQEKKKAAIQ